MADIADQPARGDDQEDGAEFLVSTVAVLVVPVFDHEAGPSRPSSTEEEVVTTPPSQQRVGNVRESLKLMDGRECVGTAREPRRLYVWEEV